MLILIWPEDRAKKGIPMTIQDWAKRLDKILFADDRDLLQNTGKISAQVAKLYQNDFDRFLQLEGKNE
jgi:hypothetical protein